MDSSQNFNLLENLPQLSPIWHDIHYQQMIKTKKHFLSKNDKKEKLIDVCGAGIDVSVHDGKLCSETKSATDGWNFASTSCALPFLAENRALTIDLADPCLAPLNTAKEKFRQFCFNLQRLRQTYNAKAKDNFPKEVMYAYNKQKKMERKKKYKKVSVPESVMGLVMDFPEKNRFPPVNLLYVGGSLASSSSENGHHVLLHPKGEKLNRLGITTLDEAGVLNKHFQIVSFEENSSPKLKSGHILQISSTIEGYCYVRQKRSCHFVDFNDLQDVKHSRIIQKQELVSISSSPYCPSDFIVMYDEGNLEFRNLEENEPIWSIFKHEYKFPYGEIDSVQCSFGSHPQSILSLNEHYLYSFDMRLEGNQRAILFSSDYASCSIDEKLISCRGCAVSPFQHVVMSNYHLFVCDERYPKRPVLIYNHMLSGYPLYCDSTIVRDNQNSSDVMVILGTQDTNELSAFAIRAQHSTIQPVSLSPPLHLSTPTDCAESLKLHCIPVDDLLVQRLSYPLVGVSVIPHSDSGYTVFHLNSLGDLFYQDFMKVTSSIEKTHQVSTGCVLTTPDKILPHLSQFRPSSVEEKDLQEYSSHLSVEVIVDLSEVFSAMKNITFCKICSPDKDSTATINADNTTICLSCGYSDVESELISGLINNLSLLIGPTKEPPISEYFDIAQFYEFNDQYSKKILDVWNFEENELSCDTPKYNYESDSSFTIPTPLSCFSSASSTSTPSATHSQDLSMQSSSKDDVISQLFNNISSLNSSLNDFSVQESYDEFVPPSQDVRPMVGETLRKPKNPKTSNSRHNLSLRAGF